MSNDRSPLFKTTRSRQPIAYEESVFKNELILRYIFKNLTSKQLKSVSRVCTVWNGLCSELAGQRSRIEGLSLIYGLSDYMRKHERFAQLLLLESVQNYESLREKILLSIRQKLTTIPSVALLFDSLKNYNQKNYAKFLRSKEVLGSLPSSCSVFSISCSDTGVIGSSPDYRHAVETMHDHKFTSGISYLFLPELAPGGSAQMIPITGCQSELCRYLNEEQIIERNIKGVITFIKHDPSKSPDLSILRELVGQQSNKIALGGILIDQINVSSNVGCQCNEERTMNPADFAALLFCGENVNCASLVIKSSEEDEVKKRLVDFKRNLHFDCNQAGTELFGFLFACAGRSFQMFHKLNLESDLIKEQFPSLKLSGIFGLGEVGLNYYGNHRSNKIDKNNVLHFYTSILVLVQIQRVQ